MLSLGEVNGAWFASFIAQAIDSAAFFSTEPFLSDVIKAAAPEVRRFASRLHQLAGAG